MKFNKVFAGTYKATRKDGQIITIESTDYEGDMKWKVSYKNDFDGDNTDFAKTKKHLVDMENRIEASMGA